MSKNSFYFDPLAKGLEIFLGPTEAAIMNLIWERKKLSVKKTVFFLHESHHLAYTTVMTVMNRLEQKKILKREKDKRAFVYQAVLSKDNFIKERIKIVKDCLKKL